MGAELVVTTNNLDAIAARLQTGTKAVLDALAEELRQDVRDSMFDSPRGGRQYRGQPGPASAPGEAPAVQTGTYADNIELADAGPTETDVIFPWPAAVLELGGAFMAARPHVAPAVTALRDRAEQAAVDLLGLS